MQLKTLAQVPLKDKTVLLRTDFNVPIQDGLVQDRTRLIESLPTLQFLMSQGAKVVIASHLGRPKGVRNLEFSLKPVSLVLSELLGIEVQQLNDCIGSEVDETIQAASFGSVLMLENLRFHPEEELNDLSFAEALAKGKDLYVSDAFGTVHRAHASTVGVTRFLPSFAGFLLEKEVTLLSQILEKPEHPLALVVGGAKIDTKIGVLERFLDLADIFVIGGALANTFLAAQGHGVGASLYEKDKVEVAKRFLEVAASKIVLLPSDVVTATGIDSAETHVCAVSEVPSDHMILDLGAETRRAYAEVLETAKTILWNGPMGLYEKDPFAAGTRDLGLALADSSSTRVLGGGDTIDAIAHFGIPKEKFTHISTGGGAMLEFLEGKMLPGVEVLLA